MVEIHSPPVLPLRTAAQPGAISSFASVNLDATRALAAQIIMLGHIRVLFFVDYDEINHATGLIEKMMYWIAGLQHESVVTFLVLSGLLISRNISIARQNGTWHWRTYLADRFARLYMVLIPGLLVGCILDSVGASLGLSRWFYTGPIRHFPDVNVLRQLTIGTFFGNLAFLQTIFCPAFGSNLPLWSLACEFWYYLLYPLLLFAWLEWRNRINRGGANREWMGPVLRTAAWLALGGLILTILDRDKIVWFLIWLLGSGVWSISQKWQWTMFSTRTFLCAGLLLFALSVCLARTRYLDVLYSDLGVGIAVAFLLLGILCRDSPGPRYSRVARATAGFSYSEYIVHFPFLVFVRATLAGHALWQPDAMHRWYATLIAAATICYAYGFSRLTESQTSSLRRWFRNRARISRDSLEFVA